MAIHTYMSIVLVYGMQVFMTPMLKELQWTRAQFSYGAGMQRIEGSIASPLVGFIVDRFSSKKVVLIGTLLASLGMLTMSRASSLPFFYGAYVLVGLGMSCTVGIPYTTAVAHWFRKRRGFAMGLMFSGATFSGLFVPGLAILTSNSDFGWRYTMSLCALGIIIVGLPGAAILRPKPGPYGYTVDGVSEDDLPTGENTANNSTTMGYTVKEALRSRSFWLLTLAFGLLSMGPSAMFIHQIPYFESIGFSTQGASWTVATLTLLSGVGRMGTGWVMDHTDPRLVLIGLVLCSVLGLLSLFFTYEWWHSLAYALLFGVSFGGSIPARPILTGAYFGTRAFGSLTGLMQTFAVVGGVIAPVLMGWVYDESSSYNMAIIVLMIMMALAIPIIMLLPKHSTAAP
jgi:MFS family permease